eukprot:s2716_g1.t1
MHYPAMWGMFLSLGVSLVLGLGGPLRGTLSRFSRIRGNVRGGAFSGCGCGRKAEIAESGRASVHTRRNSARNRGRACDCHQQRHECKCAEKDARQLEHLGTRLPDCRSRPESPAKSVRSPAELLGDPYKSHTFASNSICALACTKRESECHIINGHEPFCRAIEGYCLAQEDHPPQQLHITMQRRGARSSGIRNRHARMACSNLPVRVPGHSAINDGGPRERISACHGFSTLLLTAMSWLPPSVIARLPRP